MAKGVLLSTDVIWDATAGCFYPGIIEALKLVVDAGHAVVVVSNHERPEYLDATEYPFIQFISCHGRQKATFLRGLVRGPNKTSIPLSDLVVLGAVNEDLYMATNAQVLLIQCQWVQELGDRIKPYGIPFSNPAIIPKIIDLLDDAAPWHFSAASRLFDLYVLTEAGTYRYDTDVYMLRVIKRLRACLKDDNRDLVKGFILHLLSSLSATPAFRDVDIWAYYPSSDSANNGSERMAIFCKMARIMFKRRLVKDGIPLIVRHTRSDKRHIVGGDRTDPAGQIETVHLHPHYRKSVRGKTVAVLDDYTTYGVSFSVAAELLRKAGAKKVMCIAMGKFGNKLALRPITVNQDSVCEPITDYSCEGHESLRGQTAPQAQLEFLKKFKKL